MPLKIRSRSISSILRIAVLSLWIAGIAFCLVAYFVDPQRFSPANIAHFLAEFSTAAILVYFVISVIRGLTLLPSTPLVIAGTILFPHDPLLVFGVSLFGIIVSSAMIYYFSELLGFDEYFAAHKPALMDKIRGRLEHPLGFGFVALWAFFPVMPTDVVCYVAGSVRMRFWKFIAAIAAGEAVLVGLYVYLGGSLLQFL